LGEVVKDKRKRKRYGGFINTSSGKVEDAVNIKEGWL